MSKEDLENRVKKIEAFIRSGENKEDKKWKAGIDQKLERLENHFVKQAKKQPFFALFAFGSAISLVGITLLFQKLLETYRDPVSPYIAIGFLIVSGLVVLFVSAKKGQL